YAVLTHCWGPSMPEAGVTKTDTLSLHLNRINVAELPMSLRHALIIVKELGIPYIWIDSLCILQDSTEDWEVESAQMGHIYSHAWCTIAASSATDFQGGIKYIQGHRVQVSIRPPLQTWAKFYRNNPLNKRGWTFQERELSPRILHFSADQMWWEFQLRCLDNMLEPSSIHNEDSSIIHNLVINARYNTWHKVIQDYSTRTFTRITDRFPALSGLASEMQAVHGDEYVAGMWKGDLLRSLLWRRDSRPDSSQTMLTRPLQYQAPSWSWAAIGDAVTYDLVTFNRPQINKLLPTTAKIKNIHLVPAGSDPKGRLNAGTIKIRGRLRYYEPSTLTTTMIFHFDFDDQLDDTPIYLLSLFTITSFIGSVMGWALAVIMIEEPVPVFRRVGVVSNVYSEWFDDADDVLIPII
ncbi:HET-domain-containing protein, partial [Mollisia scopiformis]